MPTTPDDLLGDLIEFIKDTASGKLPFVSRDIRHIYVHFEDEDGADLGYLSFSDALDGLWNDIYLWPECGLESKDENGNVDFADLDIREADSLNLQSH